MESTTFINTSSNTPPTESPTTEPTDKFNLADYLLEHYIIIIIPSVFLAIFLIIFFTILIKKIVNRRSFNPKQLDTYSSINYDDENLDDELGISDDIMYTSCRLLVGDGFEENSELCNSDAEYDCMSVDISVNPHETSMVDWAKKGQSLESTPELEQSLKTLPRDFWKR